MIRKVKPNSISIACAALSIAQHDAVDTTHMCTVGIAPNVRAKQMFSVTSDCFFSFSRRWLRNMSQTLSADFSATSTSSSAATNRSLHYQPFAAAMSPARSCDAVGLRTKICILSWEEKQHHFFCSLIIIR